MFPELKLPWDKVIEEERENGLSARFPHDTEKSAAHNVITAFEEMVEHIKKIKK